MEKKINLRFAVVAVIILSAALSRLIPHPANFFTYWEYGTIRSRIFQ